MTVPPYSVQKPKLPRPLQAWQTGFGCHPDQSAFAERWISASRAKRRGAIATPQMARSARFLYFGSASLRHYLYFPHLAISSGGDYHFVNSFRPKGLLFRLFRLAGFRIPKEDLWQPQFLPPALIHA
jgi:hypothetical protein